jgi:hypothetical protein
MSPAEIGSMIVMVLAHKRCRNVDKSVQNMRIKYNFTGLNELAANRIALLSVFRHFLPAQVVFKEPARRVFPPARPSCG